MRSRIESWSLILALCAALSFFALGAQLAVANTSPRSCDFVRPNWGEPGTTFTHDLIYYDSDGDAPSYVRMYIDDVPHEMTYVGGSYTSGAKYRYTWVATSADVGAEKDYWFEVSDGMATARSLTNLLPTVFPYFLPNNYKISLFTREDNTPLWSYETDDWVRSVSLSSDGRYVVAVVGIDGGDKKILLFGRDDNDPLWSYTVEGRMLTFLQATTITSDGSNVAAVFGERINLFDRADNTIIQQYPFGSASQFSAAGWSGDASELSLQEGEVVWNFVGEMHIVGFSHFTSSSISQDGNYLVTGVNNSVYLFDRTNPSTPLRTYEVSTQGYDPAEFSTGVVPSFSFDGGHLAVGFGCPMRSIYLFSRDNDEPLWGYWFGGDSPPYSVSISPNGERIIVGLAGAEPDVEYNIFLFGREDNAPIWKYSSPGIPRAVAIDNDGNRIVVGGLAVGVVRLFSDVDNDPLWSYQTGGPVYSVSISADGNYIGAGSKDSHVYLLDTSGNKLWRYDMGNWVSFVSISSDGNYIVAGSGNSPYAVEEGAPQTEEGGPQTELVTLNAPADTTKNSTVLSWSQSTAADFVSYAIYKSTSSGALGDQITTITDATTTTITITALSPNTTYYFTVRVNLTDGTYDDSNQVSVKTLQEGEVPEGGETPPAEGIPIAYVAIGVVVIVVVIGLALVLRKR